MRLRHSLMTDKRCHYRVLPIEKIRRGVILEFLRGVNIEFGGGVNAALPTKVT